MHKTLDEIEKIRLANQIIARLFEDILPEYIQPGISTLEINDIIDGYIRSQGAIPATLGVPGYIQDFPGSACISVNEEIVHGIPSKNKILNEGDIISIDVVTNLNGYYGDSAVTFPVGKIDEESEKLLRITKEALEVGIQAMTISNRLGDVGNAIQKHIEKNGFAVVRDFTGHGIGKSMHEDPMIPNFGRKNRGLKIENGMVLAIEPMVNAGTYKTKIQADGWTAVTKDGKRSAHFEHSIAIVDGKAVVLSKKN